MRHVLTVSTRGIAALLESARRCGFPTQALLEGLLTEEQARDPRHRVSWDCFVEFMDRLTEAAGGLEGLDLVGSQFHRSFPLLGVLASLFVSPPAFVEFVFIQIQIAVTLRTQNPLNFLLTNCQPTNCTRPYRTPDGVIPLSIFKGCMAARQVHNMNAL